jgi:hypothetical protein
MKKTRLNLQELAVTSFEVNDDEKGGVHAMQIRTQYTCRINCTYVTCAVGCETNQYGAC